jgi:26S proteasome regulatory subunit, ATPase 3, interacting protein
VVELVVRSRRLKPKVTRVGARNNSETFLLFCTMTGKPKTDVKVLKGKEGECCVLNLFSRSQGCIAEDKVLEYLKRVRAYLLIRLFHELLLFQMNRPYGAVDVSANLKGAVPKTATQKILLGLAEKGELVMKTYGTSIYIFT